MNTPIFRSRNFSENAPTVYDLCLLQGVRDYAEQQRRLLTDITNYMQRNRDLARQREVEEEQRRQQEELDRQRLEIEEAEREQRKAQEKDLEETQAVSTAAASFKANLHLDLDPALPARSQTLESPAFVPESDLPIPAPPVEQTPAVIQSQSQPVKTDFPPSPMVSSDGRPVLALVPQGEAGPDVEFPVSDSELASSGITTSVEAERPEDSAVTSVEGSQSSEQSSGEGVSPDVIDPEMDPVQLAQMHSEVVPSGGGGGSEESLTAENIEHSDSTNQEQAQCDLAMGSVHIPNNQDQVNQCVSDSGNEQSGCNIHNQGPSLQNQQSEASAPPSGENPHSSMTETSEKTGLQTSLDDQWSKDRVSFSIRQWRLARSIVRWCHLGFGGEWR